MEEYISLSLRKKIETVNSKKGKEMLNDEDITVLMTESLLYAYTYEEKGYSENRQ